jgi:2'-5' RNA ligase
MAQSVELLLDGPAEAEVSGQWSALAAAGLPSEQRSVPDLFHRPHITLFAADRLDPETQGPLASAVAGLDLALVIGAVMIFGPRRGRSVLVRAVVPSAALLALQAEVAAICAADPLGQFGAGRWSPHVTLARRVASERIGPCLDVVGESVIPSRVTSCRRWDGTAKRAWLL